tara:strand:+ start:259 stop:954 length:696 start_codon:yes stop_codon:yes gene_type:complete
MGLLKKIAKRLKDKKAKKQKAKNLKKLKKMPMGSVSVSPVGQGKLSPTGKIRKGAVGAEVTEGGAYAKYKKGSKASGSFKKAFAKASKAGKKTFSWDGRSYTTKKASAKKAAPKKKASAKKAAPKKVATQKPVKPIEAQDAADYAKKVKAKEESYHYEEGKDPAGPITPKKAVTKKAPTIEPWKAPEDKYRTKKQLGGMVEPSVPSYEGGGKVESNPYGWPSRDARNGGKK